MHNSSQNLLETLLGVYVDSEAPHQVSFCVTVLPGSQELAVDAWSPVFRVAQGVSQQPHMSARGQLTFTLSHNAVELRENESRSFHLEICLRDNAGVADGGVDTSEAVLVEVIVIGTPQSVVRLCV